MTKTCSPDPVQVGQPIDYDFDVTNIGNVNLVNVDVNDPLVGFDNDPNIILLPGGSQHYDAQLILSEPQVVINTVYASGDYGAALVLATVTDSNSCTVHVVDARISIEESDTNGLHDAAVMVRSSADRRGCPPFPFPAFM